MVETLTRRFEGWLGMASELELEIQQHLMQYLSGAMTLTHFENWFVPILWEVDDQDKSTREMAGTVHILISEFSRGDRSIAQFRQGLLDTCRMADENRYGVPALVARSNGEPQVNLALAVV
jgi:hypothetical protein